MGLAKQNERTLQFWDGARGDLADSQAAGRSAPQRAQYYQIEGLRALGDGGRCIVMGDRQHAGGDRHLAAFGNLR